jgi:outer membrane protein assembly factor BamB
VVALLAVVTLTALAWRGGVADRIFGSEDPASPRSGAADPGEETPGSPASPSNPASPSPQPSPTETPGPINTAFPGLTTFRGNASRSYYGEGPMPENPEILWRYPESGGLCSQSLNEGVTKVWCGTGWTGQPNVIEQEDGDLEVRFGAYDAHYHFLDGRTGDPIRPDVVTGDLAKGSASSDPDGFPLYYAGSRDNHLRIVALDRSKPEVLWSLSAENAPNPIWNNDWDGAPLIVQDHMLVGGENSWFYVVKLNRRYGADGKVQIDPQIKMLVPGYDEQLFSDIGSEDVSIESSVAFHDGVAYFVNSGGLVQGWDISDILAGGSRHERVFRYWNGDDSDASVVIDQEGFLYVARHGEHSTSRDREIGDLMKLDPKSPNDPLVWSVHVTGGSADGGGIWATPALYGNSVYVTTNYGEVVAVNRLTGRVFWKVELPGPLWGSPVPIDDQLLVGDCNGVLHNFDISDRWKKPTELWSIRLEGCLESTPAVWKGMVFVGTRGGPMYGIGDPGA